MSSFLRALEQAEQERLLRGGRGLPEPARYRRPIFWAANPKRPAEQTRFDLALYIAVAMIFATAMAFQPTAFKFHRGWLGLAEAFMCLAGIAVGVIASRGLGVTSVSPGKAGLFRRPPPTGGHWVYVQHACFGLALLAAVLSVLMGYGRWLPTIGCPR